MPLKRHRLPQTFPHKIVFIISLVLCLCACGSIVNAVIAWSNYLWGYYLGTGFWSGAVILLAGMFGIVASYVRSICAVKTFLILSIFGCIASLGMIALASGGLDPQSGFYSGFNKTTFMTHIVHAVYLGLGVLQLTLGVISDGICIYYLFIGRSAEIYCVKSDDKQKNKKTGGNIRRQGKDRSSTGSQVPLVGESRQSKRNSTSSNQRRSESIEENAIFPIPYTSKGTLDRPTLLRQEMLMSKVSPIRNPYNRSASFSTFGRIGGQDRESLIVHATDDNASVANTVTTNAPHSPDDECHYAQTMLFGPPVPIEQDEVLPPYEIVDSGFPKGKPRRRGLKRPKSEELNVGGKSRARNSAPERDIRNSSKKSKSSQVKSKIPQNRYESSSEHGSLKKKSSKRNNIDQNTARLSRSADLLSFDDGATDKKSPQGYSDLHEQGVAHRDFAHSSDMILDMDQAVRLRHKRPQSQIMKINRERRLDRRRKAYSAEFKVNKDSTYERIGLEHRSDSTDGSNSSLFASNRIMPTKFSLRTRMRQIGMPHVCSPVPVKPIVLVPKAKPPPKPPRSYSVKAEDLKDIAIDMDKEVDTIFADIDGLNNNEDNDDVFAITETSASTVDKGEKLMLHTAQKPSEVAVFQEPVVKKQETFVVKDESVNVFNVPLSPEVKLDSGPVLKYIPPQRETKPPVDNVDGANDNKTLHNGIVAGNLKQAVQPERHSTDTMVLPTSPIMRPPPVAFVKSITVAENIPRSNVVKAQPNELIGNKTEIVYAKVSKKESPNSPVSPISPTSPSAKVLKAKRLTYTFKDRDVSVFDPIGNSKEVEETIESKESISLQFPVEKPKGDGSVQEIKQTPAVLKHDSTTESRSNVTVRQPPLSPSERILQRKAKNVENRRDLSPSKEERPVIIQPTITSKDINKDGARPKTSFKGLFAPLVPPKPSHGHKNDKEQKEGTKPVTNTFPSGSYKVLESQQKKTLPQQLSYLTSNNPSSPPTLPKPVNMRTNDYTVRNNETTKSVPNGSVQLSQPSVSTPVGAILVSGAATRAVPVNHPSAVSGPPTMSSNSQGVMHLPQSQYSRQVSDTIPPSVSAANNRPARGAAQNINVIQQGNNNQVDKPLFSVVL